MKLSKGDDFHQFSWTAGSNKIICLVQMDQFF